ncbi:alpha/beta hydrolase [Ostreiculturibacter nitratireducens]|uniref:alpha/beta hydrolase n=1 Tax=Ostreiculturibacter nitratireducens TaxID=3075226 RepID=UPI0031B5D91A
MTRELNFGRRAPVSGTARSMVVFLHGYGADGADLLSLADPLGPHLPDTVFVAPDAPERPFGTPFGYQWFPIPWLDGSSQEAAEAGLVRSAADLDAFLDAQLQEEGLPASRLAVIGFSQGTMMALHVLPRRSEPVAAIVAFSGRLLDPARLAAEAVSKPPVLLLHGDRDEVVPFASMQEAGEALSAAGFPTYGHVMKGTGHGIAPDGLGVALSFLKENLPGA